MTRKIAGILFCVVSAVLFWQIFQLYLENRQTEGKLSSLESKTGILNAENQNLQADLEYLANPQNLEKEIRERYNYKRPGEKVIIVVPPKE